MSYVGIIANRYYSCHFHYAVVFQRLIAERLVKGSYTCPIKNAQNIGSGHRGMAHC